MADDPFPNGANPAPVPAPARTGQHRHDLATSSLAWSVSILATLVGLLFLAWLVLYVTKGRFLKPYFEKYGSSWMTRQIKVAGDFQFYFDPIDAKFLADGLTIANPAWAPQPNLFAAKHIDVRFATLSLLASQKRVHWINMDGGAVDLEWDAKHKTNTWTLPSSGPIKLPLIETASITGTTIRYRDPASRLSADVAFQAINAKDNQFANAIRFSGGGTARGAPFRVWGAQSTPNELLHGGKNRFELHAEAAESRLDVSGTLPGATVIEGADLNVGVRGQNLRTLFDLAGIAVPDTRAYRLRSHLTKQGDEFRFTGLTGNYGDSDLSGSLSVNVPAKSDPKARMKLTADLRSRRVDMIDIGPFIGYDPNALAKKGAVAAATTQKKRSGTPRILPDAPLRIDAISRFDADVRYRVADIKQAKVPVSNIDLGLILDHSLLKLSPLNMDVSGGHLASDISIDARRKPVETAYDIRLSPTPVGKMFKGFGLEESGTTGVIKARIKMTGEGDTVRQSLATSNGRMAIILPTGHFWTRNAQLAEFDIGVFVQRLIQDKLKKPIQINCGLIAFTVRDGVAAADPILIDTDKNLMAAKGGFSFKDESIAIAFRARGKKFSLFSAQSPVGIGGYFAAPKLQIVTPQLLARGGAAAVLGLVGGPAAILAFVDPGTAKSAACGPVLAGATATRQESTKGKPLTKEVGNGTTLQEQQQKKHKKFLGIF